MQTQQVLEKQTVGTTEEPLYLTRLSYYEQKAEMLVEFSNTSARRVERYRFFPYITFSKVNAPAKMSELVLSLGFRNFNVVEKEGVCKLYAASMSELKKISTALAVHTSKLPLVLPIERAFLLEKEWSYFDSFVSQGSHLFLTHQVNQASVGVGVPQDLGFFLTKELPFSQALKLSEEDAMFLVEQAAWSQLLKVPIAQVPKKSEERIEAFLENVFFKNGELLSFEQGERMYTEKDYEPFSRDATSQIDFSLVWAELFSNTFFNLGPETRNCACCAPGVLEARNLLPSSRICVKFKEDNLYFESSSESFAVEFHQARPFKEERRVKKNEFFLNSFPVGPFFKDDSVLVPLSDAQRLIREDKAVLVSSKDTAAKGVAQVSTAHELTWFCKNKESFFSREVREVNTNLLSLQKIIDVHERVFGATTRFEYLYAKEAYRARVATLALLSSQLTSMQSKFFSTALAKNILSVQEATRAKFKEFSEAQGYRVLHAGKNQASVKGFNSLKLAKSFAQTEHLPQPNVSSFTSVAQKKIRAFS